MSLDDATVAFPRRVRLASELRGLRDAAGVSGRALANRIGVSQSKVSRIENGSVVPTLPEVDAWSRELGLPDDLRRRLAVMTKAAHTEAQPWRSQLAGKGHLQNQILERECAARNVRIFQSAVVPGLLQTPDYARAVFSSVLPRISEADRAAAVAARMDRQLEMYEGARTYEFLITEAALRWRPGSREMLALQFDRIAHLATLHNVSIGLIPLDVRALTITGHGFVIYDREECSEAVVETVHAEVTASAAEEVEIYEEHWSLLKRMSISGSAAREFASQLAAEYRSFSDDGSDHK
ncbi:helix-turn-helix domain-containing protein [Nocardia beijingensis]|uniref:helix-turn-helix domain-containing protein n=1 Tax=Nocardia beijingensis TaxID=95162 RepID=UPI0018953896|nr:helix-turn-helix transcriptional regulator [Nocardia beijingensis]MBF6469958.1 helix-turn-helix domain-containing protein [Nocardia beijingensis]